MNASDGREYYGFGIDNSQLRREAQQAISILDGVGSKAEAEGARIDTAFRKAGQAMAAYFSVQQLSSFINSVIKIRGEIESLEISFETLLGNKDAAKELFSALREFEVKTPMTLEPLAKGAQTLLGFGVAAEKVMPILRQIGDISMGNTERFNSLVLAFSQVSANGKLMGQDLLQMVNAGFNPLNQMSKDTGKSMAELRDEMSKGAISAADMEKAFAAATVEGGQFYGMLEKQSQGISGSLSNLEGAWSSMLNEIGKESQDVIVDAIHTVAGLVENYKEVGRVVAELVATYGVYKAAVMTLSVAEKLRYQATLAHMAGLTKMQAVMTVLKAKTEALNAVMLKNPYMLAAAAVATLAYGIYKLCTYQTEAEKAQKKLNKSIAEAEKSSLSEEVQLARLKGQLSTLTKGTKEYDRVKGEIVSKFSKYYSGLDEEISKVGLTEQAYRKLTDAIRQSFGARQYEKFASEQQSSLENIMSDNLEKIQDRLYKELGDESGAKIYEQIRQGIIKKQFGLGKGFNNITGLSKDLSIALDKVAGKKGDSFYFANRAVEGYIANILKAEKLAEEMDAKAKVRLGIQEGNAEKKSDTEEPNTPPATYADDFKAAKQAWETAKKELEAIERDKDKFSSKQYEDAKKRKEAAEKAYKDLGGDPSGKASKAQYKAQEDEKKRLKEVYSELEKMRMDHLQADIDLMQDGTEKKIAQIALDYDKEIAAILAKEKEWKDAQGGKLTKEQTVEIRTALVDSYVRRERGTSDVNREQAEAERQAMNEYLKEYGSYQKKRQAITAVYNEKIAKATTKWERLSLAEGMKKELADVDNEAQKSTSIITRLFDDMSKKNITSIRAIADEAEKFLSFLERGEYSSDNSFGITEEQFDVLRKSPDQLKAIKDEIANVRREADQMETSFNKVSNGLKKVFASESDARKLKEGLAEIEEGMNEIMQAGQFLSDTFSKLGDSFGGVFGGIAEGLNVAMDSLNSAMQGAQAGAMLGLGQIGMAAGAAIGVVSSLAGAIAKIHDKKNEKRIQRLQDQIDTLDKSYGKLEKSIEKAYSKDASKMIEQNNKLLEQQKILIQQQIREEQDKKKTDDSRIKEWQEQIEEINDVIADNKEKAVDAIFGEDLKSAIDNFANAQAEAWASGEDRAESAKDTVKKMMRQMVTESIKAATESSGAMEKIRDKLKEFYLDNVLTGWEQDYIYNMAEQLQQQLDKQFGWADGLMSGGKYTQEATKGGYATASQDSIDELSGRFTASYEVQVEMRDINKEISINIEPIKDSVMSMRNNMEEMKNLSLLAIGHLESIAKNTHELFEMNERLGKIEKNTRNL